MAKRTIIIGNFIPLSVSPRVRRLTGLAVLGVALLWAYWPTLWAMGEKWATDPQYSHGFLVPVFAAALLWRRWPQLKGTSLEPSAWGGALVLLGLALHLAGAYVFFDWLDMISLLPLLAGLCLCYGGRPVLRWAWLSIGFLIFMLPLPFRLEVALSHPLQRIATLGSTYTLQTLGFAAVSEGNIIILSNARIGVVEACNGLGMLVTFIALATAVAIVLNRPVVDKVVILFSAVPIALLSNLIRITITGILATTVGSKAAEVVFHDLAGWFMMPLALGLLWIEVRLLSRLLLELEPESSQVLFAGFAPSGARATPGTGAKETTTLNEEACQAR